MPRSPIPSLERGSAACAVGMVVSEVPLPVPEVRGLHVASRLHVCVECNNDLIQCFACLPALRAAMSHLPKEFALPSQLSTFFSKPRNVIRVVAVVLLAAGTYGQLTMRDDSAPAADSTLFDVAMTFTTPAGAARQRAQVRAGQAFNVSADDKAGKLTAAFTLTAEGADAVKMDGAFGCGGASAPHASFTARLGAPTAIKTPVENGAAACQLDLVVTKLAELAPAR